MLINLSNHPSGKWPVEQVVAARKYGIITDLPFPEIDPAGDENYIDHLASEYLDMLKLLIGKSKVTVHIMGEMTFTYALVSRLMVEGIECIASTSERFVIEMGNGQKQATFRFVRFRTYNTQDHGGNYSYTASAKST